jgi:hypothetical protein
VRRGYRIVDEPAPSPIANLAVRPLWPLLGLMLGGAWLAWPWFVLNGRALGAPNRARTLVWVAAAVVGSLGFIAGLDLASARGWIPRGAIPWEALVLVVWKMTVGYVLHEEQSVTSELFAHFGGRLRNGAYVVAAGFFVHGWLAKWIVTLPTLAGDLAFAVLW